MNLKLIALLCCFGLLVYSCQTEQEVKTQKLKDFVSQSSYDYNSLKAVLILSEKGCPTCNRSFSIFIQDYLENEKNLCVISAKGNNFDISAFFNAERIVMDLNNDFGKLGITEMSSAIFLDDAGNIDTIIPIRAKTIKQDLAYISKQIELL